ncbi:HSP20-like chaperone, partial [Lindgomyces ingoldianus]
SRSGHRHNHHNILAPDFDVRETERAYFLEGEFPGIRDRESVRLEWVDCRTLAIEAKIVRVELENEWGGLKLAEAEGQKGAAPVVREWLSERRVGHYQRTFTFPADVEAGGVRARLGQGLLRILVPKLRERTMQAKKVEV